MSGGLNLPSLDKDADGNEEYDASPKALGELKDRITPQQLELPVLAVGDGEFQRVREDLASKHITSAFAPEPTMPQATDVLFDAWALTSIEGKMPGRPEVGPYLHGIADDLPQTTIVWRAELDLLKDNPNPKAALKAIFAKHRVRPHESLTVRSYQGIEFFKRITAPKVHPELLGTRVALIFAHGLELTTVKALIDNPAPLNADPTLVLPPSFGGLDERGMLSVPQPRDKKEADSNTGGNGTVEQDSKSNATTVPSFDIADMEGYERERDAKARLRVLIERSDNGWSARAMPGAAPLPNDWNPQKPPERSTPLVNRVQKKSGLKVRLVQPLKWDEEDDPVSALVCLSPPPKQQKPVEQTLHEHVAMVEKEANRLADALLQNDGVAHAALRFAAKWHDQGKEAQCWQRYIGGPNAKGEPLGKSAEWRNPRLLAGYRHEFGSLLRMTPHLPDDEDVRDLALHLVAAHHGHGRPHFTTQESDQTHTDAIRRFARLQRRYGRWGLAYLESLLRAADAIASRTVGNDPEGDNDDFEGGDA